MIWQRQLPEKVKLDDDVDINTLALKYELSGGYIRNAVQAALSRCCCCVGSKVMSGCSSMLFPLSRLFTADWLPQQEVSRMLRRVPPSIFSHK